MRLLPDWTAILIAVVGIALRVLDGSVLPGIGCAALVFLVAAFLAHRGFMGGGDVKLLAACTLLVAPSDVLPLIFATSLFGGVLALLYLVLGRSIRRLRARGPTTTETACLTRNRTNATIVARIMRVEAWRISRRGPLPYGCAIAMAAIYIMFGSLLSWR